MTETKSSEEAQIDSYEPTLDSCGPIFPSGPLPDGMSPPRKGETVYGWVERLDEMGQLARKGETLDEWATRLREMETEHLREENLKGNDHGIA